MTYLLYFRSKDPATDPSEFIILTQLDGFRDKYEFMDYELYKVTTIDEDLYELPLDTRLAQIH